MGAGSFEDQDGFAGPVDKKPIPRQVTFATFTPLSGQPVVPILRGEGLLCREFLNHDAQNRHVLALALQPLDVPSELSCSAKYQMPKSSKSSSTVAKSLTSSPRSDFSRV